MRVWLITIGEPLPTDSKSPRLLRTGLLGQALAQRGHDVLWWSSSFDHTKKRQRSEGNAVLPLGENYRLQLLRGRDYERNVSLARLANHREVAAEFRKLAPQEPTPDVILCSFPTIELSAAATEYGQKNNVPVVLDVRDMWPDIFVDLAPRGTRPLARLGLASMFRQTRNCCRRATAITGHAPGFVQWGLQHGGRTAGPFDRDFPFGYNDAQPAAAEVEAADRFWKQRGIGVDPGVPVVCFFGALGKQFVMEPVIRAFGRVNKTRKVQLVICGQGDRLPAYRSLAADHPSIHFPGWVESPQIWTLMRRCRLAIAPYQNSPDFQSSIPNKAIEYMSGGLPIVSSLTAGVLNDLLIEHDCGISYGGDEDRLVVAVEKLLDTPDRINTMSTNASRLFRERFRASVVYHQMSDYLEEIAAHHRRETEHPAARQLATAAASS